MNLYTLFYVCEVKVTIMIITINNERNVTLDELHTARHNDEETKLSEALNPYEAVENSSLFQSI